MLNEDLLTAWLRLSNAINNQRLVKGLSFNEALVCNLLAKAGGAGGCLTAGELCRETRILKSQMNAILLSLEEKGLLRRQRSQQDRRRVELWLTEKGIARYEASHGRILELVDRLIAAQGDEAVRQLIPMLHQLVDNFNKIQQEV